MLAFAAGYVAMSRHVINAGAFYAYAARGLGGSWGGAVSVMALVAYNTMQFGLIGLLGGISAGVFSQFGMMLPWWVYSLIAILLVGILGYRQVDLSAKVMVVLVGLEYLVVLIVDFAILAAGGAADGHRACGQHLDFDALMTGSLTAAILFCLGSFIGIEATTIYGEEARDPEKTIPRATYLSILMIGVFFVFTTWLMIAGTGADKLIDTIAGLTCPTADRSDDFFMLAETYTNPTVAMVAGLLLVSSLFAALSAFHNYIARYSYVAGRDGLLPEAFGRTHDAHQSPHIGSVVQTIGALIVLAVFAGLGLDPILNMFTWISQIGTLGVIGMMAITSLSVIAFLLAQWRGVVPVDAALAGHRGADHGGAVRLHLRQLRRPDRHRGRRSQRDPAGADPAGGADRPAAGAAPEIGRPRAVCPDGPEPERMIRQSHGKGATKVV
jgi:amino acid transporter